MDQQEDQRRANRHVPRAQRNNQRQRQRRNMAVQRRNVVHSRVLNFSGPRAPYPQVLPSSQQYPPHIVYGPNEAGRQIAYLAVPPASHIPPEATHIAVPLTHMPSALSPTPQILHGGTPRFVRVGPPGALNGASSGIMRFPTPREEPVAPMRVSSPNAFVAALNGSFSTGPASGNAPPHFATPSRVETFTYRYSNSTQRVVPPPVRMPTEARIVAVDNMPPIEEVQAMSITEVVSSSVEEEFN